jgi:hemerythrin-like domain-containing protein
MASTPPPWADAPFPLLPTPGRGQEISKLPPHLHIACEMACAHNALLRGLNSIYQQCPFVSSPTDIKDLLTYTTFWCSWIREHHEGEETLLFPALEEGTGVKGLMEKNVEQHHAFMSGFRELETWVKEVKVEEYDGGKLRGIIDQFGEKLTEHLSEEITTLLELKEYDGVGIMKAFGVFDKAMQQGEKVSYSTFYDASGK